MGYGATMILFSLLLMLFLTGLAYLALNRYLNARQTVETFGDLTHYRHNGIRTECGIFLKHFEAAPYSARYQPFTKDFNKVTCYWCIKMTRSLGIPSELSEHQ